jgi:glyoxylase-like metal-dependent hydrolase (beta-lactamase superfamily II)
MTDEPIPDPAVRVAGAREIAPDLLVIPKPTSRSGTQHRHHRRYAGRAGGRHRHRQRRAGPRPRRRRGEGRRLYLTTTHFHPEHAFGAQVFASQAIYLINRAQADDLQTKGPGYLEMFRGLGGSIAHRLDGVQVPTPDVVYDDAYDLDLGGRTVVLRPTGRGHTKGDQVIEVPDADVLFTGDLAETGQFAIFPWFPPHDTDVSGVGRLAVMDRLAATEPRLVVPGHGDLSGPQVLTIVRDYLRELRDETWRRRDSAMAADEIVPEVQALLIERHPEWAGQEWIERGVGCLCAEHND